MNRVGVLDYGAGNLMNVLRAIEHLGFAHELVERPEDLRAISKLIIPGVGAYNAAMGAISQLGMVEPIRKHAERGNPVFGICLGMQLLFDRSFEFVETQGLGLIGGDIIKLSMADQQFENYKLPHIGWNSLKIHSPTSYLLEDVEDGSSVYFVHSYKAKLKDANDLIASCEYAGNLIPAVVQRGNIMGCQYHPEKSGKAGLRMLSSFLRSV